MSDLRPELSNSDLPMFFDDHHDQIALELNQFAQTWRPENYQDDWLATRAAIRQLAEHQLIGFCIPERDQGRCVNQITSVDTRALTLTRECLGYLDGLLDHAFMSQGMGMYPIAYAGTAKQRARYLPDLLSGQKIGAFALTEPQAGSDHSAIKMRAKRDSHGDYLLSGQKVFVSNLGVATHYIVFATQDARRGVEGISAFIVEAAQPHGQTGDEYLTLEPAELIAPQPIGSLTLRRTRIPAARRLGDEGEGFKIAMETLSTFRLSIAGAALGIARRALHESIRHVNQRKQFGGPLMRQQSIASQLADAALELDAARLLVYRAAYLRDMRDVFSSEAIKEAAMAKLYATESAQRIVDLSVQLHGGLGVTRGSVPERLYREIRGLRIYGGPSELQRATIAHQIQKEYEES